MCDIKFSVNWDSYINHVSKGLSHLQQNAEFVDMTLAADGHLVKVHQNVVALASPYLKAMLQSATCRHPVIFLHSINSEILGYILEYIYTGEVKIPTNVIDLFIEACKSLCIKGLETVTTPTMSISLDEVKNTNERTDKFADKKIAAHIRINTQDNNDYNLEVIPNQNNVSINNSNEIIVSDNSLQDNENNDIETEGTNVNSIRSINNLIILEPNTYTNTDINKISKESNVKILANINLNQPLQTYNTKKSENMSINVDDYKGIVPQTNSAGKLQDFPMNIAVTTDSWQFSSISNILKRDSEKEGKSNNIIGNVGDLQMYEHTLEEDITPEPGQSSPYTELNRQITQDTFEDLITTEDKEPTVRVLQNLKKIRSFTKLKNQTETLPGITLNTVAKLQADKPHFTISNRGALQMILHRFLYHNHHYSHGGRKRRWRCIDYRKLHCRAFIDTDNEEITAMSPDHSHPNHENILKKKIKMKIVFTSLSTAITTINTAISGVREEDKQP